MVQTTVSSRYQVVIPKEVRERTGIHPGDKLDVTATRFGIRLVRVPSLDELRGIARGEEVRDLRDKQDRF